MIPPTRFHTKNFPAGTRSTPATGFMNVRTIGMNRASTIALAGPNRFNTCSARSTYSCLNRRELGRAKSFRPYRWPSQWPSCPPATAQTGVTISSPPVGRRTPALQEAGPVRAPPVRRLPAPQPEEPLRQQRVEDRGDVEHQRADPEPGDLLGHLVDLDREAERGGAAREVLAPALEQPEADRLD